MIQDYLQANSDSSNKLEEIGIGGFKLFAKIRETTNYVSQAPTTYLEDGSFASDHIVLEPLTIEIEGSVSDVYIERSTQSRLLNRRTEKLIDTGLQKLPSTQAELNKKTALIESLQSEYQRAERQIQNPLGEVGDTTNDNLRERFIESMEKLYYGKQLVSIDTEFRKFDSMRITNLSITKDNQNTAISFSISAQKVRIAKTQTTNIERVFANPTADLNGQAESEVDKGTQQGERSLLGATIGLFGGSDA